MCVFKHISFSSLEFCFCSLHLKSPTAYTHSSSCGNISFQKQRDSYQPDNYYCLFDYEDEFEVKQSRQEKDSIVNLMKCIIDFHTPFL